MPDSEKILKVTGTKELFILNVRVEPVARPLWLACHRSVRYRPLLRGGRPGILPPGARDPVRAQITARTLRRPDDWVYIAANIAGMYTQSLAQAPDAMDNSKERGLAASSGLAAASASRVIRLMRARSRVAGADELARAAMVAAVLDQPT